MRSNQPKYTRDWVIIDKCSVEGGFVDNPDDLGGVTNHGVTEVEARRHGYLGNMRDLTMGTAIEIYRKRYWDRLYLDHIHLRSPLLADLLFDVGINCGRYISAQMLQNYLNVNNNKGKLWHELTVDGVLGNSTVKALDAYVRCRGQHGIYVMLATIIGLTSSRYMDISLLRPGQRNETFTFGWFTRAAENQAEYASVYL